MKKELSLESALDVIEFLLEELEEFATFKTPQSRRAAVVISKAREMLDPTDRTDDIKQLESINEMEIAMGLGDGKYSGC
jgi:hypothetical protein